MIEFIAYLRARLGVARADERGVTSLEYVVIGIAAVVIATAIGAGVDYWANGKLDVLTSN